MIYHDLISFKESLPTKPQSLYLIILKDSEERKTALQAVLHATKSPAVAFQSDLFSIKGFLEEVHTLPLLAKNKAVILHDIDQLGEEAFESVLSYLSNPSPWVLLLMTAGALHSQNKVVKCVEKNGALLRCKEEKPWEKEKRLAEWLAHEAAEAGVTFSPSLIQMLIKAVDPACLKSELDKLICFAAEKKEITKEAIKRLVAPMRHETLWQLGDALFERSFPKAVTIGTALLEEGMAFIPLLAHLRTQMHTGMQILHTYNQGGGQAVTESFPYLKGGFLEKKLTLLQGYGLVRMQMALIYLFETEVQAKNSAADPSLLLETLLAKLIHDTLSSTQSHRTCF